MHTGTEIKNNLQQTIPEMKLHCAFLHFYAFRKSKPDFMTLHKKITINDETIQNKSKNTM